MFHKFLSTTVLAILLVGRGANCVPQTSSNASSSTSTQAKAHMNVRLIEMKMNANPDLQRTVIQLREGLSAVNAGFGRELDQNLTILLSYVVDLLRNLLNDHPDRRMTSHLTFAVDDEGIIQSD
ncbi:hypothetical protein B0H19DRAFT_1242733 [Mycena capillaripes]|nr:hypothetical protein B0H19DRAFT_1242733 [Mycena capillaripes]